MNAKREKNKAEYKELTIRLRLDIEDFALSHLVLPEKTDFEKTLLKMGQLKQLPLQHRRSLNTNYQKIKDIQEYIFGEETPVVTVCINAKHLCGAATDLALRSYAKAVEDVRGSESQLVLRGHVMVATCCHQVCDWNTFTGSAFLSSLLQKHNPHNFTPQQLFTRLRRISCWGTNHDRKPQSDTETDENTTAKMLGEYAKRILDFGRLEFCQTKLNLKNTDLLQFIDKSVSPENRLLLAW